MPLKSGKTTLGQIWASLIFCLQFSCVVFLVGRREVLVLVGFLFVFFSFIFFFFKQQFFFQERTP